MSFHGLSSFGHSTQGVILEAVFRMLPTSNLEFLSICVRADISICKLVRALSTL